MTGWLDRLPEQARRLVAWALVLTPLGFVSIAVVLLSLEVIGGQARVAGLQADVMRLQDGLISASAEDHAWLAARGLSADAVAVAGNADASRAAFDTAWSHFVSALEAAGMDTSRATAVGETTRSGRVAEMFAAWSATVPLAEFLAILDDEALAGLPVSELRIRAVGTQGEAEVFVEFRLPFAWGLAS
jgi:hypothetical protein